MSNKSFFDNIEIKDYDKIIMYKQKFENKEITEDEIPEEYLKYIRKIYIQNIQELRGIQG